MTLAEFEEARDRAITAMRDLLQGTEYNANEQTGRIRVKLDFDATSREDRQRYAAAVNSLYAIDEAITIYDDILKMNLYGGELENEH